MVWGNQVANADILYGLNLVSTILSLFGSSIMIYACLKTYKIRSISFKFLLAIAISDFVYAIANLFSAFEKDSNDVLCHIEAFIRQFSFVLSVYFVTCTAVLCYRSVTSPGYNQKKFFNRSLLIGCLYCLFLTSLPLFTNIFQYQNGDLFCWISYPTSEDPNIQTKLLVILTLEGAPVFLGLTVTFFGYLLAIKKVRELTSASLYQVDVNVYKLLWYPLIVFITFVPGLIDNLVSTSQNVKLSFGFEAAHLTLTHSIGFTNALVYGLQRNWKDDLDEMPERDALNEESQKSITDDLIRARDYDP